MRDYCVSATASDWERYAADIERYVTNLMEKYDQVLLLYCRFVLQHWGRLKSEITKPHPHI